MLEVKKLNSPLCQLGECLLWDYERNVLFWLDIEQYLVYSHDLKKDSIQSIKVDKFIGSLMLTHSDRLLTFADNNLFLFDLQKNRFEVLDHNLQLNETETLSNDGKIDRDGNIVFGTKHETCNQAKAAFYFYHQNLQKYEKLASNITVFNGPAFSPQGDKIYFADSPTGQIISANYQNGYLTEQKIFAQTSSEVAPDGMTVDSEGYLWNAEWNGFCVKRYAPDGSLNMKIELPVPLVTNVCFGGEKLDTLYITTAFTSLTKEEREKYPESGSTFYVKLNEVKGLREKRFFLKL